MKKVLSIILSVLVTTFMISAPTNAKLKTPKFLKGKLSGKLTSDIKGVHKFFNDNKDTFDVENAENEFAELSSKSDEYGFKHIKIQQTVDGIPVYGNEYVVHFNNNDEVYAVNGFYDPVARGAKHDKGKFINENKAKKIALDQVKYDALDSEPVAKLYLYDAENTYVPAYEISFSYTSPDLGDWSIFVNAETGEVIQMINKVANAATTGTGIGVLGDTKPLNLDMVSVKLRKTTETQYQMRDLTRGSVITTYSANYGTSIPGTLMYSTTNVINDKAAVDAHYYAGVVYDYYKNKFARNSIDNRGMAIKSSVHYKRNYVNAAWTGGQMVYGDGDGVNSLALSGALDVIGHEMSHGVDSSEANLIYANQSGALNESISDTFGTLIEYQAQPSKFDWLIGEDVWTPSKPGDALRSMSNPGLYGDPDNMSKYVNAPNTSAGDWGGVHTNSGIANKAFYNTVMNISSDLSVSMPKAEKIYYRALCDYMTSSTDFSMAKQALAQAAVDLYGAGSAEYNAVINGWTAVGVN